MKYNGILSIIVISLSIFFLVMTFNLPDTESAGTITASVWPMIILFVMLLMGILLALRTYRERAKGHIEEPEESESKSKPANPNYHWLVMAVLAGYTLAMPLIGFLVATPLFIILLALVLGMTKIRYLLLTSLISHGAAVLLFLYGFNIPLPRGIGFFRSFSFLIY
ncbi:tripartite tricarboxylate transporter TctB family protein [Geomicrobium sp. JSM 1781026]|uniref:tripartite tricarboxylate transporter TctB family protein n=1 Tax=Geomicrobium sp. JSM 1781026 TaxID=3344580 RepID=UPI0035C00059